MKPPGSSQYTVTSRAPGTVTDFAVVPGAASTRIVWATIQPLDARTLRDLEPGLQSRARFACFTFGEALVTAQAGGAESDTINVGGVEYEVHGGFNDGSFAGAPFPAHEYILAAPEISS